MNSSSFFFNHGAATNTVLRWTWMSVWSREWEVSKIRGKPSVSSKHRRKKSQISQKSQNTSVYFALVCGCESSASVTLRLISLELKSNWAKKIQEKGSSEHEVISFPQIPCQGLQLTKEEKTPNCKCGGRIPGIPGDLLVCKHVLNHEGTC